MRSLPEHRRIGWGIRGNFGHEYGAMIPGALAAMAGVLVSGRHDWWSRIAYFGMFGALGWSFGGSISYMWVIGYTHSGHFPSQVYGYACLYVPMVLSRFFGESAWQTNWHSVLEQTYGFLNGVGIAVTLVYLARRAPKVESGVRGPESGVGKELDIIAGEERVGWGIPLHSESGNGFSLRDTSRARSWTMEAAVVFVLIVITYQPVEKGDWTLRRPHKTREKRGRPGVQSPFSTGCYVNIVKNVPRWVELKAMPARLYGISSLHWFLTGYALLAAAIVVLLDRHRRRRLALIPETWLGKGQLLYIVFLWWIVVGNWMRAIPVFQEQRLITEGVIHVNAVLCTVLILLWPQPATVPDWEGRTPSWKSLVAVAVCGVLVMIATVATESYGTRAIHGDTFVGHSAKHIRFGPDATGHTLERGKEHP